MQIQLANVVKSQEEILLEALEFLQAYIKGITIHFLLIRLMRSGKPSGRGLKHLRL